MSATLLLKALGRISEKKEDLHHLLEHGLGPKVSGLSLPNHYSQSLENGDKSN